VRRAGLPADIAAAILFMSSDAASITNGQTIILKGGWTAYSPTPGFEPWSAKRRQTPGKIEVHIPTS
jgi:hypothetical protein